MNETVDIYLLRAGRSDQGTEGVLAIPELLFSCFALELPWRDNRIDISCIPPGTFSVSWRESRRFKAFHIRNVPGRSGILIHSGNFAGDVSKGLKSHVEGCILLGSRMGYLQGQRAVLNSRKTVGRFNALLKGRTAQIIIKEAFEAGNG